MLFVGFTILISIIADSYSEEKHTTTKDGVISNSFAYFSAKLAKVKAEKKDIVDSDEESDGDESRFPGCSTEV